MVISSRLVGYYNLSIEERLEKLKEIGALDEEDLKVLRLGLEVEIADKMIENVIGVFGLPLGIATNFVIDGKEYLIPMVIEEPSVVAAASNGAKMVRAGGGFKTKVSESLMISQVEIMNVKDREEAKRVIIENKAKILEIANGTQPELVKLGGGARDLEVRFLEGDHKRVIVHLIVDCLDAMGANIVNTMAEKVAPFLAELSKGKFGLRILSNLADKRIAKAWCSIPPSALERDGVSGDEVRDGVIEAWRFADLDPYRAATHNKGIMNGIDAVVIATGNDWRAVEAGAHSYAVKDGQYKPLSKWYKDGEGNLVGELSLPLAVGVVGGASNVNPVAKLCRKIIGVKSARELSSVIVAVGLAQNLAALAALATEGIQKGHMYLHARSLAISAGALGEEVEFVAEELRRTPPMTIERAKEILERIRKKREGN